MAGVGKSSSSRVMTPPPSVESPSLSSSSTGKRAESDGPGQGDSGGTSPTTNTSTTTSTTSQAPPTSDPGTTTTTTTSDHTPTQTTSKTTQTTSTTSRTTRTSDTETTSTHTTTSTDEPPPTSTTEGPTSTNPPSSPTNESNNTPNVTPQNSASAGPSQTVTSPSASQSYTTITTVIDGQSTTFTSPIPTSLSTASPNSQSNRRNAIIAGSTAAGIVLLLLLLSGVFVYRRKQLSSKITLDTLLRPRRSKRERRGLLDGEFEDDEDEDRRSALAMRAYRDFASTTSLPSAYSVPGPGVDSRSMTPTRVTPISTSSGVPLVAAAPGSRLSIASMPLPQPAPPAPGEPEPLLVTAAERAGQMERIRMPAYNDPFDPKPSTGLDLSLGNLVDDVMGPSPTAVAATNALAGSSRSSPGLQVTNRHSSSPSYDSTFSGGVPLDRHSTQGSLLNDPFRSASPTKSGARPDGSVYFPQPDTSEDLAYDGIYSQGRRSTSPSSPTGSGLGLPPGAAAPKKPSPLARALSSASSIVSNGIGRAL